MKLSVVTRIIPPAIGKIEFGLVGKGKIIAKVGQEVCPNEVIARGEIIPKRSDLNLAEFFKVSPSKVSAFLAHKVGDKVSLGEVLAQRSQFLQIQKVLAPMSGIIKEFAPQTGVLTVESLPVSFELTTPFEGKITQIKDDKIIEIQAGLAQINGVWGLGCEVCGALKIFQNMADLCSDYVLIIKEPLSVNILYKAQALGAVGIVTGSMHRGELVNFAKRMPAGDEKKFSLMISEGFGEIPMGEDILSFLKQFEGKAVLLCGEEKKLMIPQKKTDCSLPVVEVGRVRPHEVRELKIGDKVRLVMDENFGKIGGVVKIDENPSLLPSGLEAILAEVALDNKKVKVPGENLEIIG